MTIRRSYVDGPFGQIHLRECGDGDPLLLLHPSPVSSLMFEPALPALATAGFHAIALDTPGYGMSAGPEEPPSISGYAATIGAVMDAFGLQQTYLVGNHTGASIAASFVAANPARIKRLVLNGVALFSAEDRARMLALDLRPPAPIADGSHLLKTWELRAYFTPGWTDLAWMHKFLVEGLVAGPNADWATRAVLAHDLAADLRQLAVPTLFVTNSGDNLLNATRDAAALQPDCPFLILDGGTQDYPVEYPELWSRTITDFLRAGTPA